MNIQLITAPTIEPVDLMSLKLHLRLDSDAIEEDEYLEGLIKTAREQVEDWTGRQIMTATWDYSIPGWPRSNFIKLPGGNLQTVTSIVWLDTDGVSTTLVVGTDYLVETNGPGIGRIVLPFSVTWPSWTLYPSNPITIRYVSGWATVDLVPYQIKAAIKMLCAKLYESRGEDQVGNITVVEDQTAQRLLYSQRLWDDFI